MKRVVRIAENLRVGPEKVFFCVCVCVFSVENWWYYSIRSFVLSAFLEEKSIVAWGDGGE